MTAGLLPCPFCAAIESDHGVILHTDDCYLMLKYMGANNKKLLTAWNTRPREKEIMALMEERLNNLRVHMDAQSETIYQLDKANEILRVQLRNIAGEL